MLPCEWDPSQRSPGWQSHAKAKTCLSFIPAGPGSQSGETRMPSLNLLSVAWLEPVSRSPPVQLPGPRAHGGHARCPQHSFAEEDGAEQNCPPRGAAFFPA